MSFWRTLVDLLLPRHCLVCNAELNPTEDILCNVCLCNIEPVLWKSTEDNPMLRALWSWHDIERAGSSFYYNSSSDFHEVFIALKYRGRPQVGEKLARLSFPVWRDLGLGLGVDYVVPVPLAYGRRLRRGYNQAEWIARGVSSSLNVPLCTDVIVRRRSNETQTRKSARERRDNTAGIFVARPGVVDLNGKGVLIVDDVMTTGSTLSDCIRALREVFPSVRVQIYTLGWAGEK